MADIGGSIQTSWGSNAILNMFPNSRPYLNLAGLDAVPDTTILDTQIYAIDIFQDFKTLDAKGSPMQTVWFTIGGGEIAKPYDIWTDEYRGDGYITIPWEHLRLRDTQGYNSQARPYRVGENGELGGKLIWQKCAIQPTGSADTIELTGFDEIDDASRIHIVVPVTTHSGNVYADKAEIKEFGLVNKGNKILCPLGFSRQGASSVFTSTVGMPYKVIEMMESTLRARGYVGYDNMDVYWERVGSDNYVTDSTLDPATDCKTVSYLYEENTSKRVMLMLNNIEIAKTAANTIDNVYQSSYAHKWVAIDQFIFTKDMTEFVMVLDFAVTNIDFLVGADEVACTTDPEGSGVDSFIQITRLVDGSFPTIDAAPMWPGDIIRFDEDGCAFAEVSTGNYYIRNRTTILLEEVNTAADCSTYSPSNRVFGVNVGVTDSNAGGTTSIAPFVTINLHDDIPLPRHETEGFPVQEKTGYKYSYLTHSNFTRIHHSNPWTVSIDSQNTEYKLKSTIERNRKIYLEEYKHDWNNIFLYEKGQNLSDANGYKGTTSGVMDRERFPIRYAFHPLPTEMVNGDIALSDASYGQIYQKWLEDLAEINFGGRQRSDSKNVSVAIGKDLKRMIRNVNSMIASNSTNNVFGWNLVTQVPKNELYLGIPAWQYDAGGEKMTFFEDPSLNDQVTWKLPYYLFPNASGKASPRFLMIGFDKSNIGIMTRKGRSETIYGNLQVRNNPFVYTEAVSASHMVKMRFCATNHSITNFMPNYRG